MGDSSAAHFIASEQLMGIPGYGGFPKFLANNSPSNASSSDNSSGSPSPPCFRGQPAQPDHSQPTVLADDDDLVEDDSFDGYATSNLDSKPQVNFQYQARNDPKLSASQAAKLKTTTAERRATHNAIERARRESLNGRFLELARALPTMHNVKRPSKSVIVNKSLEWICESQMREYELLRENAFLRNQVNELRAQLHMDPLPQNLQIMHHPSQHVLYKPPGGHPLGQVMSKSDATLGSSAPYAISSQPQHLANAVGQQGHGLNVNEGQYSPSNQDGFNHHPTAGPFAAQPQPGQNFANPHEGPVGSEPMHGECKSRPLGCPVSTEATPHESQPGAFQPVRLSHPGDRSFQSASEPDGPTSSVGSSPRPRLRYFSSSGSSDGSANSPPQVHGNGYQLKAERRSIHAGVEPLDLGTVPVNLLGGSGEMNKLGLHTDMPLSHGVAMSPHQADFDPHSSSVPCRLLNAGQFTGPSYASPPAGSHDGFVPPTGQHPNVPRSSIVAESQVVGPGMLAMMNQVNGDGAGQMHQGYQIGSSWVW